jgi:hypothetical protein
MAKKISGKQATIQGLMAAGHRLDTTSKSNKYLCYSGGYKVCRAADGSLVLGDPNPNKYFIGRSGALRVGRIASDTVSLSETEMHRVLQSIGRGDVPLLGAVMFHVSSDC